MDRVQKTKCDGEKCDKISQYDVGSSVVCVGCIKQSSRKHASHKRMELQILNDITRGVKKSLPGLDLDMKYDTVYHDKQRPDLLIRNTLNKNIVMVEVDENQHFSVKNLEEDDIRFKKFYDKAKSQGRSLSVVRIVPGEKSKTSMFKTEKVAGQTKLKRSSSGYIQKNSENYNKYIKESVNKITRIIGDKQSYLYKDQQISIGPTVPKNSRSPIFSDTSSPDLSPYADKARAIIYKNFLDEYQHEDIELFTPGEIKNKAIQKRKEKKTQEYSRDGSDSGKYYTNTSKQIFKDEYSRNLPNHNSRMKNAYIEASYEKSTKKTSTKKTSTKKTSSPRKKSYSPPPLPKRWW
jgi:hypothetical protein